MNILDRSSPVIVLFAVVITAAIGLSGCDTLFSPEQSTETTPVRLTFENSSASPSTAAKTGAVNETPLTITGEEGDLVVTDFRFIMTKFEIENKVKGRGNSKHERTEFRLRNHFVDVPLDITEEEALGVVAELPEGTYNDLDLKISEHAIDESDHEGAQSVREAIEAAFPDWPENASMVAVGRFEPAGGGDARPFTVYLDAEVRVHLELDPPLEIVEGEQPEVTVDFDPERLFQQLGEPSLDLSQYDGQVVNVEVNVKDSFEDVKFEMK